MRGLDESVSQKRRFEYLLGHLFFWVSGMESLLIFYTKQIRKTKYIQIHD